jgi:acetyltransferase-like isoleucine patch superfamily enzyme
MRWLIDLLSKLARLVLHERLWAPVFVLAHRFIVPQFERASGRASLWYVPNVPASVRVHGRIHVLGPHGLKIGEHVRIGRGCFFHCLGGLTIGDNTQISRDVVIYTASHDYQGDAIPYDITHVERPVVIGRSVWIGMRVCIAPGVTIGDGAVIGLGAVIAKDVPAGAVVVGAPQRQVHARNMDRFRELDAQQRWFGRLWPLH